MNANTSRSIRVGLFFIVGAILVWIVYDTFTAKNAYNENAYILRAPFEDVKQLKVGNDVRLSGVSIGSVAALRLEDGLAVAILQIEKIHKVPVDSLATITTAGLLGNNYISIQLGGLPQNLEENDTVRTKEGADINKIVEQLGDIGKRISGFLDDLSGQEKGSLLGGITGMIEDVRPKINGILDNMADITNQVASGKGSAGKFIYEDTAHTQVVAVVDTIKKAAGDAEKFFKDAAKVINKLDEGGDGPLSFILNDKNATSQLRATLANVNDFTQRLNSKDSTLGKLISDDDLYVKADSILNKVHNAVEGVENSGPMTAVGIGASALF